MGSIIVSMVTCSYSKTTIIQFFEIVTTLIKNGAVAWSNLSFSLIDIANVLNAPTMAVSSREKSQHKSLYLPALSFSQSHELTSSKFDNRNPLVEMLHLPRIDSKSKKNLNICKGQAGHSHKKWPKRSHPTLTTRPSWTQTSRPSALQTLSSRRPTTLPTHRSTYRLHSRASSLTFRKSTHTSTL